jgi:hypothetical protein
LLKSVIVIPFAFKILTKKYPDEQPVFFSFDYPFADKYTVDTELAYVPARQTLVPVFGYIRQTVIL